jgi:flagellar motor switch protein FliM
MVVLVTLETKVGDVEGMMNFCIPYLTIEPIVNKLSVQFWYSSARRTTTTENLTVLKEKLNIVDVPIAAEIGHIQLPIKEVLSLRVGDIINLYNVRVGDPYSLNVGNKKKFLCRPGVVGKKMAVQITKKLESIEREEFGDLDAEAE